jgi:hypothetical protein
MPPHIRDPLHSNHQGPASPTAVSGNVSTRCDVANYRTWSSSPGRLSDGIKHRPASFTHTTTTGLVSRFNHDIDVKPREQRRGKSVSFNPILRFKAVKHINDYSDKEYSSLFLTEDDLEDIFDECVENVKMMVRGEILVEEDGYCPRGLEFKTPRGARARKESKANALKLVLDEQELQVSLGYNDTDAIATIYRDAATDTLRVSRIMAMKDEEAARPLLQSKSSVLLLRQKKMRGDASEQDFDVSVPNLMEEFNESWENCLRPQKTPTKSAVRRVQFDETPPGQKR